MRSRQLLRHRRHDGVDLGRRQLGLRLRADEHIVELDRHEHGALADKDPPRLAPGATGVHPKAPLGVAVRSHRRDGQSLPEADLPLAARETT